MVLSSNLKQVVENCTHNAARLRKVLSNQKWAPIYIPKGEHFVLNYTIGNEGELVKYSKETVCGKFADQLSHTKVDEMFIRGVLRQWGGSKAYNNCNIKLYCAAVPVDYSSSYPECNLPEREPFLGVWYASFKHKEYTYNGLLQLDDIANTKFENTDIKIVNLVNMSKGRGLIHIPSFLSGSESELARSTYTGPNPFYEYLPANTSLSKDTIYNTLYIPYGEWLMTIDTSNWYITHQSIDRWKL